MVSPQQSRRHCFFFGAVSLLVYGAMAWLSLAFVYGQGHSQRPLLSFVGLYAAAFLCYFGTLRVLPYVPRQCRDMFLLLGFALLFRGLLLISHPIQEDDFYRYLWDGKVVASGLNPYRLAPQAILENQGDDEDLQRYVQLVAADDRFALILSRVNHPEVPTIYPPLAQATFGLIALVAPGSLLALRFTFLAFDIGICALVLLLLRQLQLNPLLVLVYAWSPLVIKETINSAHYDVVPTFFLVLALVCVIKERLWVAYLSLALAILGKVYPVLLVPVFFCWVKTRWMISHAFLGVGIITLVVVLGYVPFLDAGSLLWQGTQVFAERWQTNSLLFPLLRELVGGERWVANVVVTGLLGILVLVVITRVDLRSEQGLLCGVFLLLAALFLFSPVGNPWYFLWLVPLLCVFPLRSWLLLSGLLGLYYLWFYFSYQGKVETFGWVIWLEYIPFYGLLIREWSVHRSVHVPVTSTKSFLCSPL